jgi:hypothetical protein
MYNFRARSICSVSEASQLVLTGLFLQKVTSQRNDGKSDLVMLFRRVGTLTNDSANILQNERIK